MARRKKPVKTGFEGRTTRPFPLEGKEAARKIYANEGRVLRIAQTMYDAGERVSVTNVYHAIKGALGLSGAYNFDAGDAIREILREAGWIPDRPF